MFGEFKPSNDIQSQLVEDVFRDLFTIDENNVLHPTEEFDNCEGCIGHPYLVFESSVVKNYIQRNYPENKSGMLLEFIDDPVFSFINFGNKIRLKLAEHQVKNPYSDNIAGIVIALDPKDISDNSEPVLDDQPDLVYRPDTNRDHVYLIKSKEANESYALSFADVSYAYRFMVKLKQFYKELGYDKEFSIEHLNLYKINNPKVLCIGLCYLVPNSLFEHSTPLDVSSLFETYHYLKTDELEMVIIRKNSKQVNDVLQYRLYGESDFNAIVNKVKEEVDFDFKGAYFHETFNDEYIFFTQYRDLFRKEVGQRCIDLVIDRFMEDYYFDKLANGYSQFVAVDIWDLSEKLLEFIVNQDHYRESMPGITIGDAYKCLSGYIRDSKHLEIASKYLKESKQLVMCSHMGGKYLPVELQCLETGSLYTNLVFTPNPEEYEKYKDSYPKNAFILDNVYLKDTLMKLIDETGKVRYTPVLVGYVSDDTDIAFNFSDEYIKAMNKQMVYLRSDGTVGQAFTGGIPTGRVYSVPLEELNENYKEVHYHLMGRSANVSIGIYPSNVDFSLTKYYSRKELPSAV